MAETELLERIERQEMELDALRSALEEMKGFFGANADAIVGIKVKKASPSAGDMMKYDGTDKVIIFEAPSTSTVHALASTTHSTRAHSELTDVGPADHHSKYTSATRLVAASDASQTFKDAAEATADGTNDEVEIQAAIDALPAVGGKVLLSDGTFTLGAAVNLGSKNNVVIEGQGDGTRGNAGTTLIKVANGANIATGAVLTTQTAGAVVTGIHLRHFILDGNKANQASGDGDGIYLRARRSSIQDVEIAQMRGRGVYWQGNSSADAALEIYLKHVRILDTDNSGLELSNYVWDGHLESVAIGRCAPECIRMGANTSSMQILSCHFYGGQTISTNAIKCDGGGGSRYQFVGCRFENAKEHGVLIDVTAGGSTDMQFIGCRFLSNSRSLANTYDDLLVTRVSGTNISLRGQVVGCRFTRSTGTDVDARYGVSLAGAYAQDWQIGNCHFLTAHYGTAAINDAGTSTTITDNHGANLDTHSDDTGAHHAQVHAASHAEGGSDDLAGQNVNVARLKTDSIVEQTGAAGVTIDGFLCKDISGLAKPAGKPGVKIQGMAGGTGDFTATLAPPFTMAANRVITLPDAAGELALGPYELYIAFGADPVNGQVFSA